MTDGPVITFRGMAWFRLGRDGYAPFDPTGRGVGPWIIMRERYILQLAARLP